VSLDFLDILGRRKKNKISQGEVWADLTPPPICDTLRYNVHEILGAIAVWEKNEDSDDSRAAGEDFFLSPIPNDFSATFQRPIFTRFGQDEKIVYRKDKSDV